MINKYHSKRIKQIDKRKFTMSVLYVLGGFSRKLSPKERRMKMFKYIMKYVVLKWQNPNDLPYRKPIKQKYLCRKLKLNVQV